MALRARLSAPQAEPPTVWPYHKVTWTTVPSRLLSEGDRRMEAENYLLRGYGVRLAIEAKPAGWVRMDELARVWQPSRLKGIQVNPEYGTPFLSATQVYDARPTPRKWLALEQTPEANERFVAHGTILVTCSGNVGRATLAFSPHLETIITHDLLRVSPRDNKWWGWLYAYLRAPKTRAMMTSSRYGHVIKHLEASHLNALPVPRLRMNLLESFSKKANTILQLREKAHATMLDAEACFEDSIGPLKKGDYGESGFVVRAGASFHSGRRRLDAFTHNPTVTAILESFEENGLKIEPLYNVTERVWWMTRFKRVFGEPGVPYMSAEELFTQNPDITKQVLIEQTKNADGFFVKAGWLMMACSGQVYGTIGSVALMSKADEQVFFSHDLIRIIPNPAKIQPGYLLVALGHPKIGRPLVVRHAYGTSIPHLEPSDVATTPIVRLNPSDEERIAELAELSVNLRLKANLLENQLALDAEEILDRFISGDTEDIAED